MVNYYIYATDDSQSTMGQIYFNTKGLETLNSFHNDVKVCQKGGEEKEDRVMYLHWSDKCVQVEEDEVVSRYMNKNGLGSNTLPHTILDWIVQHLNKDDAIRLLYVITDGMMHPSCIKPCDPNMNIDTVKFYAFNTNVNRIDMSVASMFICNNKRYIVYCNDELVDETDLSNPFDYSQITIDTFSETRDKLKSYIKLQFLCKHPSNHMALEEIKKLKHLRTRLFDELETARGTIEVPINLNVTNRDLFVKEFKRSKYYKTLMNTDESNEKQNIESCITTLINYINNDKKSFKFDNLKFTQTYTPSHKEEEVLDVNYENAEEIAFPDIITSNDTGVPVILLTHYSLIEKILFKTAKELQFSAHFSRFKSIMECPLILLQDDKFKSSIEYFYNLEAFKSMVEHGIETGPRTRQPFTGAIVPLEQFHDYNDYILSCTYFGGRRVPYNKGLLYYVLYKTCEKLEFMEPNVVDYLKGYVVKRIANTECYLGLSGVSIDDPLIKVNLTTALWYCVELSSLIFKDDTIHYKKERMRMYSHFAQYMIEILHWFDYKIDTDMVNTRVDIFKHLNKLKRLQRYEEKISCVLQQIFKKKDGFLLAEIVNPQNIYKLNYVNMDHKKLVDVSLLDVAVDVHDFVHFMDYVEITDVPVCHNTMRPFFITEDKTSFYEQLIRKSRKVRIIESTLTLEPISELYIPRILPLYKLYISYVQQYQQFPTLEQYKVHILNKKQYFNNKAVVFSKNTIVAIENIHRRYEDIVTDAKNPVGVGKFVEITKQSANRENRIMMEGPRDFNIDGISNYIKQSERNVIFA